MSLIVGIDPGLSGAYAAIDGNSGAIVALDDLPIIRDGKLAWIDSGTFAEALEDIPDWCNSRAVVERQQAMPTQGRSSTFTTGVAFGSLLATLQTALLPIEFVTAAQWKRALGLLKCDKQASIDKARLLFPAASLDRKRDHGRAEALLLAHYWRTHRAPPTSRDAKIVSMMGLGHKEV